MENDFKKGDVVKLNSGSLSMTVTNINGDIVSCVWFDNNNAVQCNDFFKECLKKI